VLLTRRGLPTTSELGPEELLGVPRIHTTFESIFLIAYMDFDFLSN